MKDIKLAPPVNTTDALIAGSMTPTTLEEMKEKIIRILLKQKYITDQGIDYNGEKDVALNEILALISTAKREALREMDIEAIQWAYKKLLAYGAQNSSTENAMMMDRLNDLTHLESELANK